DGSVWCWGVAVDGQLGNGTTEFFDASAEYGPLSTVPVRVQGLSSPAVSLTVGDAPCVVTSTGTVSCWGLTCENAETPVVVTDGGGAVSLSIGGSADPGAFACAVTSKGAIECWGSNLEGQLGDGRMVSTTTPVEIASASLEYQATEVAASQGGNFACAVGGGDVECWGDNSHGQLGDGTTTPSAMPV